MPLMRQAGQVLRERFHGKLEVTVKGWANIVTDVDYEVERLVLGQVREQFSECAILAEESGAGGAAASEWMWIVDPLDGTRNYARGLPHYCTTMALAQHGEVKLGVTYDPSRDELFWAEAGQGAWCDGQRMQVSQAEELAPTTIGADMGYSDGLAADALALLGTLWPGMQAIRVMGSAALGVAYAAQGRYDLYFHHKLAPWDIAAGIIMGQEAGGVVTDRDGKPITLESPSIIVSSRTLVDEFLRKTEGTPWRTKARQ